MSPNASPGSRLRLTGRVAGVLVLAGLGFRELRRGHATSKPRHAPRTRLGFYRPRHSRRHRGRAFARTCFVLSAVGVVALPVVWFTTRPASDVGVLTGIRAARAATTPTTAVPLASDQPPIPTYPARLQDQAARVVNRPVAVHIPRWGWMRRPSRSASSPARRCSRRRPTRRCSGGTSTVPRPARRARP